MSFCKPTGKTGRQVDGRWRLQGCAALANNPGSEIARHPANWMASSFSPSRKLRIMTPSLTARAHSGKPVVRIVHPGSHATCKQRIVDMQTKEPDTSLTPFPPLSNLHALAVCHSSTDSN